MDLSQAVEWSREQNVDFFLAECQWRLLMTWLIVCSVVKALGRTRIHGRRGDKTGRQLYILVESSAELDQGSVPPEVGIVGEAGPWAINVVRKSMRSGWSKLEAKKCSVQCSLP
ncbi:hypothetical protein AALO_G00219050 [Alosa alosa]|uniref:Uncharacterized protein n=1 Tax=Alosa alosa TaxID=278164 RepID=A0AAV6FWN9_9TELE|nr:hypothetical protein AALO_G00219050 [Alosa alosa]